MRPSVGTLYPYLSSLVKAGWLEEKWPEKPPSEVRRPATVYVVTAQGRMALQSYRQVHENLQFWSDQLSPA